MSKPLVSVIVSNYNYARYLPQALNSVLAQSYSNIEIIVVDDGSTDDSENVLRSYENHIRWIRQKNQGVSAARNRGVKETRGELIAFLDADDIWLPLKLERQVERFLDDPELGLVHCGMQEINDKGEPLCTHLDGMEGWVSKEMLLLRKTVVLGAGSSGLVSRDAFEAVGGFDTQLSTSADFDFVYRVAVRQRVGFVPEVLFQYRIHGTNMHAKIKLMEHDTLLIYAKAFSAPDPETQRMRRQCYGNLHMTLAGSFFRSGQYYDFSRHLLKSLWFTPSNCTRIGGFPARWWQRRASKSAHPDSHGSSGVSA